MFQIKMVLVVPQPLKSVIYPQHYLLNLDVIYKQFPTDSEANHSRRNKLMPVPLLEMLIWQHSRQPCRPLRFELNQTIEIFLTTCSLCTSEVDDTKLMLCPIEAVCEADGL